MDTHLIDCEDLKTKAKVSFIVQATWGPNQNTNYIVGTYRSPQTTKHMTVCMTVVCMYVCMYEYMYVCVHGMYVCMYV